MSDTSDWGNQVSNNQTLLGSFAGGTTVEEVAIPPNVESIIIVCGSSVSTAPEVIGVTTGAIYPVIGWGLGGGYPECWLCLVTPASDSNVEIQWNVAPVSSWYVVSDQGVRIVGTISNSSGQAGVPFGGAPTMVAGQVPISTYLAAIQVNSLGQQSVVPSVPSVLANDHPSNELLAIQANLAGAANVLAAPGAGKRYRIFYADLSIRSAVANGLGVLVLGATQLVVAFGFTTYRQLFGAPSGIPMPTNTAVSYTVVNATNCDMAIVYTVETV